MGVLEDAIREHLELKRQHGASEEEVVRQETEVLGRARLEAAPAEEDPEAALAEEAALDEEAVPAPDEPASDEPLAEPPPFEDDQPAGVTEAPDPAEEPFDHQHDPEPPEAFTPDDPSREETALLDDPVEFDELEPGVAPPMPAEDAERSAEDEDVLEETPDFLQETPEHDRLWFEQKPPRDFDFD